MENKKRGLFKRIGAIIMSAFLTLSGASDAKALDAGLTEDSVRVMSERMENYNSIQNKEFKKLAQKYDDVRIIGDDIFSIDEILDTKIEDDLCETMVPQGLTILDDMFLVTAYDGIEGYKKDLQLHSYRREYRQKLEEISNHKTHNSVIYLFDRDSKEQIATIELPDINHVGGIANDGKNIYIAKSTDKQVSIIPVERIRNVARVAEKMGKITSYVDYENSIDCENNASFVNIRENKDGKKQLCVGTWSLNPNKSKLRIYDIEDDSKLELKQEILIQISANGAEFVTDKNGDEYLLIASSFGRSNNSRLYINKVEENENGKLELQEHNVVFLPPMVEEVVGFKDENGNSKIGIGTEAFARRYEIGRSKNFVKGILIADLEALINLPLKEIPGPPKVEGAVLEEIADLKEREEEEREI